MMKAGIRDMVAALSHTPIVQGVAEKFNYGMGLAIDALIEKLDQAMLAHMPTKCDPSALAYIGNDRNIGRGFSETDTSYGIRLQHSFEDWQRAGSARSVLRQVLGMVLSYQPLARTVADANTFDFTNIRSPWDTYLDGADTTQPPSHQQGPTGGSNWNWDGVIQSWRWWLIMYPITPQNFCNPAPTYGTAGRVWGDTTMSWGFDKPASLFNGIRSAVKQWEKGGSWCRWMIFSFDNTLFIPGSSSNAPDGTWGTWSKNSAGTQVATRSANARYADGTL